MTDFLTEYGEAVEEAKQQAKRHPAPTIKKPHIRRR